MVRRGSGVQIPATAPYRCLPGGGFIFIRLMTVSPYESGTPNPLQEAVAQLQALPGQDAFQLAMERRWHELPSAGYLFLIQAYPGSNEGVIDMVQYDADRG